MSTISGGVEHDLAVGRGHLGPPGVGDAVPEELVEEGVAVVVALAHGLGELLGLGSELSPGLGWLLDAGLPEAGPCSCTCLVCCGL